MRKPSDYLTVYIVYKKYVLVHELGNCPKPSIENGTRQPEEVDENQPEEDDEKTE